MELNKKCQPYIRIMSTEQYLLRDNSNQPIVDQWGLDSDSGFENIYARFLEDILQLPPLNDWASLLSETLLTDSNPNKLVLSESGEKNIATIEYDPVKYPNISCCPITIKDFQKGDTISKLPCSHLFNTGAILKWLKEEKAECPICRFKLDSVEINETMSGPTVFGPPRLPRSGRVDHFRRLMEMRQQRDEKEELEAVLLASLETY